MKSTLEIQERMTELKRSTQRNNEDEDGQIRTTEPPNPKSIEGHEVNRHFLRGNAKGKVIVCMS